MTVSDERVFDVWRSFFNFPLDVAEVLTSLTVKDGALPQGAIPSSYLANLALWRDEPLLQAKLAAEGVVYSRYVDDIAMSSSIPLAGGRKTELIAAVYGMLRKNGLFAKREKHEIHPATKRMITTKLIVNRKASLTPKQRSNTRAAVYQAEALAATPGIESEVSRDTLNKASNRVGQLSRFHPNLAEPLRQRLKLARDRLGPSDLTPIATSDHIPSDFQLDHSPWDDQ